MSVELRPFGVACNIACHYCYQNPQREAGNVRLAYDLERMKAAVRQEGGPFTLFGGEPLLMPLADLEELFRWGLAEYGENSIQTNGTLIADEHMRLFQQYKVQVGVSVDGPGELNDLRWHGSPERTRESTERTLANIARLCREHHPPGLIITLHRGNATAERLPRLLDWVREMDALGIPSMRLHLLEVESEAIRERYSLTEDENIRALLAFADLQPAMKKLRFDVLDEMSQALRGDERGSSCVWHACDPYTTPAVRGVEGNGQSSNCGRTNKDGVNFIKAEQDGFERYLALHQTPQADGGCQGCRFFLMCKGQCPGTAIDGDWRNRSELCGVWMKLFTHQEERLIAAGEIPLSVHPVRPEREQDLLAQWRRRTPASRIAFVGEAQRAVWAPRMEAVRTALGRLAVLSVVRGLVPLSVIRVAPAEVLTLHNLAAEHGLHTRLLEPEDRWERLAIGSLEDLAEPEMAALPSCCRRAMQPAWSAEMEGPPQLNPFLRRIGLDLLGYQSCSFECEESLALARKRMQLGREEGMAQEMDWLEAMLGWPVEWSALHGVAEVKTGIFRMVYATDYTSGKVTARYLGRALAPDAARGLTFAYQGARRRPWAQ